MGEDTRKKVIITVIAGALFMEMLDTTIINTAIPEIARSFAVNAIHLKLAVTSYLVGLAVFIPISGWAADRFGTKKIFLLSIFLFTASSFLCGLSQNLIELSILRAIQGFSGALMNPVGRLIMIRTFPPHELVRVTTYIYLPALIGPLLGPLLGGVLTTYTSWRYIFFINIPIGILLFIFIKKFILNEVSETKQKLDTRGFVFSALSLAGISFGFETLNEKLIPEMWHIGILILGVTFFVLFIFHALKKKEHSILNLYLFNIRTFRYALLGMVITALVTGGIQFLLPLMFQLQFGMSPALSGLFLASIAVGALAMRSFVAKIVKLLGFKKSIIIATVGSSIFFFCLHLFTKETPYSLIILTLFFQGLFSVMMFSTNGPLLYADIDRKNSSSAATIDSALRPFVMSISIGLGALLLMGYLNKYQAHISDPHAMKAFQNTLFILWLIFLAQVGICFLLKNEDGQKI